MSNFVARLALAVLRILCTLAFFCWGMGLTVQSWGWVIVPLVAAFVCSLLDDAVKDDK